MFPGLPAGGQEDVFETCGGFWDHRCHLKPKDLSLLFSYPSRGSVPRGPC